MIFYLADDTPFLNVEVDDDSYRFRELMGGDELVLKFNLTEHREIPVGAYCIYPDVGGTRYEVLTPESVTINHRRDFEYTVKLESDGAKLRKFKLYNPVDGRLKFDYTARAEEHLQLIVDNLVARYGSGQWAVGSCIASTEKLISYNHNTLEEVLGAVAETFETEWQIVTEGAVTYISLGKVEYNASSPLPLSYGKGNGFVSGVSRTNFDDNLPIGKLYIEGGDRNIDYGAYPDSGWDGQHSSTLLLPRSASFSFDGEHFSDEYGYDSSKGVAMVTDAQGYYVKLADAPNDANEDSLDVTDIYPSRVGRVTSVLYWNSRTKEYVPAPSQGADWTYIEVDIVDSLIPNDLDYSACLMEGQSMTLVFQSGMLSSREFEVKYRHTATNGRPAKRFELVKTDYDGVTMPGEHFVPEAGNGTTTGDEYAIFGIMLPAAYFMTKSADPSHSGCYIYSGASYDALREAATYLFKNKGSKYTFKGELDGIYAKRNWSTIGSKLVIGGYVRFTDESVVGQGVHYDLRIASVKDFINNPYSPTIELSDEEVFPSGGLASDLRRLGAEPAHTDAQYKSSVQYTKRSFHDAVETSEMLEAAFAESWGSSVNPVSISTMQLIAGSEMLQVKFWETAQCTGAIANPVSVDGSTGVISGTACYVQHCTLDLPDESVLTVAKTYSDYHRWHLASMSTSFSSLDPSLAYYLYAKCPSGGSRSTVLDATYELTTEPMDFEEGGYYYFLVGILNSERDGNRSFAPLYGYTEILPNQIATGSVKNASGTTILDLDTGVLSLNALGSTGTGSGVNGNPALSNIAAWYGGPMADKEATPTPSSYAESLFRFDGTGYLAGGNITWNADGSGSVAGGNLYWDANGVPTIAGGIEIGTSGSTIADLLAALYFENPTPTASIPSGLIRLKSGYSYVGVRKGLIFDAVGSGQTSDADLYVKEITVGNTTQRVLYSPLPLITEGDQIVGDGTPGGGGTGGASNLKELDDVYHNTTNVRRYTSGTVQTGDLFAYDSTKGWYALQLGSNLYITNGVLNASGGGSGTITSVSLAEGATNGTIHIVVDGTAQSDVAVHGLGTMAYETASNYQSKYPFTISGTSGTTYNLANFLTSAVTSIGGKSGAITLSGGLSINSSNVLSSADTKYKLTLNGTTNGDNSGTSLGSFYAPTTLSGNTYVLIGGTSAPAWTLISGLSVGTAAKLSTVSKTAWGQKYWTDGGVPDSVSGDMTSVGNVTPSANKSKNLGSSSALWAKVYSDKYYLTDTIYFYTETVNNVVCVHLNAPFITDGDQIVMSGTPGGGGTGGAGYLYELGDVYHDNAKTKVLRADGTDRVAGDLLSYTTAHGWVALDPSTISGTTYSAGTGISIDNNIISVTANTYAPYNSAGYLPLSAGSTKALTDALYLKFANPRIIFQSADGTTYGNIAMRSAGVLEMYDLTAWRTVYHDGNLTLSNGVITIGSNTITPVTDVTYDSTSDRIKVTKGGSASNVLVGFATTSKRFARYQGENVAGGYDLDTLLSGGGITSQYGSSTYWANKPTEMTYGGVVQLNTQASDSLCMQFAWDVVHTSSTVGDTGKLWWRDKPTAGWGTWHLIYDSVSLTKSVITGLLGNEYHPYGGGQTVALVASSLTAYSGVTAYNAAKTYRLNINFPTTGDALTVGRIYNVTEDAQTVGDLNIQSGLIYCVGASRVGINTPTPSSSYRLDVNGNVGVTGSLTTTGNVLISNSSAVERRYHITNSVGTVSFGQTAAGHAYIHNSAAYNISLYTNATERLRVDGTGNTTVMNKLYIGGTSGACLEWDSTNGVLKINKALLTEGDQIVNSGTPGGGGGGGAGYLYELGDVLTDNNHTKVKQSDGTTNAASGNIFAFNGTKWYALKLGSNLTLNTSGSQYQLDATNTTYTGGTGITVSGSTISVTANTYAPYNANGYLPLTGGTISSSSMAPLTINSTNSSGASIVFSAGGTAKGYVGYTSSSGLYMQSIAVTGNPYVNIASDGVFKYKNTNVFLHDGNYSSYALPLTGGYIQTSSTAGKLRLVTTSSAVDIQAGTSSANNGSMILCGLAESAGDSLYLKFSYIGVWDGSSYGTIYHAGNFTKAIVEGVLTGTITTHEHSYIVTSTTPTSDTFDTYISNYAKGVTDCITSSSVVGTLPAYAAILNVGHVATRFFRLVGVKGGELYYQNTNANADGWGTLKKVWHEGNAGAGYAWACTSLTTSDNIYMPNNKYIGMKDTGGTNRIALYYTSNNQFFVGRGPAEAGHDTYVCGNNLSLTYGTSRTNGVILNSSGNVTVGASNLASTTYKFYVDGASYFNGKITSTTLTVGTNSSGWTASVYGTNSVVNLAHADGYGLYVGSKQSTSSYYLVDMRYGQTTLGSGGTVAFYVRADGNVGVGTSSPETKLHVTGPLTTEGGITAYESTSRTYRWNMNFSGTTGRLYAINAAGTVYNDILINNTITVTSNYNVGIGTSSPNSKLSVGGDITPTVTASYCVGTPEYPFEYAYFQKALYFQRAGVYNSIVTSGRNSGLRFYTTADADDASAAVAFQIDGTKNARCYGSFVRDGYDIHSSTDARVYVWNAATSSASIVLRAYSGNYLQLGPGTYTTVPTIIYGQYIRFFTYDTSSTSVEAIRIIRSGYVGIGTSSPSYKLHVSGTTGFASGHLYLTGANASSSAGNTTQIVFGTASSNHICLTSNTGAFILNPTTSSTTGQVVIRVGSGTTSTFPGIIQSAGDQVVSSDLSLKTNLQPVTYTVQDIAKARAVTFDWKDGRGHSAGSIAQDWKEIVPELVHGEEGNMTLAYGQIALINTILLAKHETEQDKEIAKLKKEVARLNLENLRMKTMLKVN